MIFIPSLCNCDGISDDPLFICSQEKQTKEALTRKQQKGKKKGQEEESHEAPELLKRPKEYTVKFTFPNPPPLSPPILGLHSECISSDEPEYECIIPNEQIMFSKYIQIIDALFSFFVCLYLEEIELNTFAKI